jgi:hypothetical protein
MPPILPVTTSPAVLRARRKYMHKRILFATSLAVLTLASVAFAREFKTVLSGGEEVPARDTKARGNAQFDLSADGTTLSYRLIVANIENVVAAHIHLAPAGENGPVVVALYGPEDPDGGRINGVIAEGTITAADLTGPLAGQPLSALIDAIRAGNAYVNVHTNDGEGATDTGAGDFASGEIRGQIRE